MASFARRRGFGSSKPVTYPYASTYDDDSYAADASSASPLTGLPPHIQRHLAAVYCTLGCMSAAATAGAVLSARTGFFYGGWLPMMVSMGALFAFMAIPVALGATAVMFVCLSAAAVLARRRSYLFLGGGLSAALSALLVVSLASSFFRSSAALGVELWVGLVVFCGYVLYDTQRIVERAHDGDRDAKRHALELFQDLFAMLVRVAIILARNQQRRDDKEERRRRS